MAPSRVHRATAMAAVAAVAAVGFAGCSGETNSDAGVVADPAPTSPAAPPPAAGGTTPIPTTDGPGSGATTAPEPTDAAPGTEPDTGSDRPPSAPVEAAAVPEILQFSAPTVDGGNLDLATIGDRPVLLWFWAPF